MATTVVRKPNAFCTNRTLLTCSLIATVVTLYYFVRPDFTSPSTPRYLTSPWRSPATNESEQCFLSRTESDGWFCESDTDWKRRKHLHHLQDKRNRVSDARHLFFQNNWEPTIQCEFERRIGNTGDGGKWVCDVHRFHDVNQTKLLIYSFGSNGDFSFERAIKEQLPQAEIHTFDMGTYQCPVNLCTFHQARLGGGKGDGSKSLQTIINELGHQTRPIHILKVDIEGSEFDLFEELFRSSKEKPADTSYIRQILFEIHLRGVGDEPCRRTHRLFELFRSNNYAIFHKEANLYDASNVFEYALLRLNPLFFIART